MDLDLPVYPKDELGLLSPGILTGARLIGSVLMPQLSLPTVHGAGEVGAGPPGSTAEEGHHRGLHA